MKREIKHIRDLAKVLKLLADEAEKKGYFDKNSEDLLKKVGSGLVFKGCSLGYKDLDKP